MSEEPTVTQYLSQSDVARKAGVNSSSANEAMLRGVITPTVKVGRAAGFSPDAPDVKAYIARERRK